MNNEYIHNLLIDATFRRVSQPQRAMNRKGVAVDDVLVIGLCDEITGNYNLAFAYAGDDSDDANWKKTRALGAMCSAGINRLTKLSATSVAGCRAKARVLILIPSDELAASLASDVIGLTDY